MTKQDIAKKDFQWRQNQTFNPKPKIYTIKNVNLPIEVKNYGNNDSSSNRAKN